MENGLVFEYGLRDGNNEIVNVYYYEDEREVLVDCE